MTTSIPTAAFNSRSKLIGAFLIAEAYSIYASSFAHSLRPIRITVLDRLTHLRVASGHIGDLHVVVNWHRFLATIAISMIVFGLTWSALSLAARVRQASIETGTLVQNCADIVTEVQSDLAAANA